MIMEEKPDIPHYKESLALMQIFIFLPTLVVVFRSIPFWVPIASCVVALVIPLYWILMAYKRGNKAYVRHLILKQIGALVFACDELLVIYKYLHLGELKKRVSEF